MVKKTFLGAFGMKYVLSNRIALRSWRLVPYAYYVKGFRNALGLSQNEYELLKRCDGTEEIPDSPLLRDLIKRELIRPANAGDTLSSWQKEKVCDNRYFPAMNWMITGKCNYNCLHCFNAADNNRLQSEFTSDEAEKLLLLHNHDDMLGMLTILPILNYSDLFQGDLTVKKVTTADSIGLIPLSNNMIEAAILNKGADGNNGTGNGICVDDNGNAVCQIYKIIVKNNRKT